MGNACCSSYFQQDSWYNVSRDAKNKERRHILSKLSRMERQQLKASVRSGVASHSAGGAAECVGVSALRQTSFLNHDDDLAMKINPKDYVYPFENLVLEGGGFKGLAYVGVVKYLEEINLLNDKEGGNCSQIKRFAGTSAGAMAVGLVALGYSSDELYTFLSDDSERVMVGNSFSCCTFLPNLLRYYGWNRGTEIEKYFGEKIRAKSRHNNPDMTFHDLYKERGVELCVVVTNLNLRQAEFCHPKTTPDMPIRVAVRMSMAVPCIYSAVPYDINLCGNLDVYVDGGLVCNYPIHCYDGWYLSMREEDRFSARLQPMSEIATIMPNRFKDKDMPAGTRADLDLERKRYKTIGCMLYDDSGDDMMTSILQERQGALEPLGPAEDTQLFLQRKSDEEFTNIAKLEYKKTVKAVEAFMKALRYHKKAESDYIEMSEIYNTVNDGRRFPRHHYKVLFGDEVNVDEVFKYLDVNLDGKIEYRELLQFIESKGIRMQTYFQGCSRQPISNFIDFASELGNTLLLNKRYSNLEPADIHRTIGVNTGHVHAADYRLEPADREFVVQRGYNAAEACFRYFAHHKPHLVEKIKKTGKMVDIAPTNEKGYESTAQPCC